MLQREQAVGDIVEHLDEEPVPGLVYVGPEINGWTPIVGHWCDAFGEDSAAARQTVERLSREYGEAHAFYFGAQGDGSAWLVAREGVTVRRFDSEEPGDSIGGVGMIVLPHLATLSLEPY